MATPEILQTEQDLLMYSSIFDNPKDVNVKSRGLEIEKKIEFLESMAGKVSNRRSRRWLNDRLLMELVPRLSAAEIRGLFAPPPWGEAVPRSPFCMTNVGEWDSFRNIDMDKEASIIESHESSLSKRRDRQDADKVAVLAAWHRVDSRTREALRRCYLTDLLSGYEECVRSFVKDSGNRDVLELQVQDPFHRLLLHGVCEVYLRHDHHFSTYYLESDRNKIITRELCNYDEMRKNSKLLHILRNWLQIFKIPDTSAFRQFYNLVSATVTQSKGGESLKIMTIRKKQLGSAEIPNITLCNFLKMAKEGFW